MKIRYGVLPIGRIALPIGMWMVQRIQHFANPHLKTIHYTSARGVFRRRYWAQEFFTLRNRSYCTSV